jgi:hypothetical protein
MARWIRETFVGKFAWLISHQPTILFSQNKPATSNQPEPASSTLLSEQTSTSHQPTEQAGGWTTFDTTFHQYHATLVKGLI